jgi:DNA-binding transcriptional LysR family regulator
MVDLNRILHFITIVECGGYTKAAQKLNLSKSTLSKSLTALEENLQIRLLNRSTRKLSLTFAGEKFFNSSLPLVTNLQKVHSEVSEFNQKIKGHLRITMPHEVGTSIIDNVLPIFMELYPDISFEFDFSTTNYGLIEEGFDLAIRIGDLEDSSYIARKLLSMSISLYASKNYLKIYGEPQELEDLNKHKYIAPPVANNEIPIKGRQPFTFSGKPSISSNSISFNKSMCLLNHGITLIPDVLCVEEVRGANLVKILPKYELISKNMYLVYPSRNHLSRALKVFNDFLITNAKEFIL